jgi:hypothetical protein
MKLVNDDHELTNDLDPEYLHCDGCMKMFSTEKHVAYAQSKRLIIKCKLMCNYWGPFPVYTTNTFLSLVYNVPPKPPKLYQA